MEELLFMQEDIKRARAQFDDNEGLWYPAGGEMMFINPRLYIMGCLFSRVLH
jgi:hypothetical protein